MKVIYDKETDTLTLILSDSEIAESDELREGIIIDYDAKGGIVSVEILEASLKMTNPSEISYEMRGVSK